MSREKCIKCGNIVSSSYLSDRCCCGGKFEPHEEGSIQELKSALAAETKRRKEKEHEIEMLKTQREILHDELSTGQKKWMEGNRERDTLRAENERMREALNAMLEAEEARRNAQDAHGDGVAESIRAAKAMHGACGLAAAALAQKPGGVE